MDTLLRRCKTCFFQFSDDNTDSEIMRHRDQHANDKQFPCREKECTRTFSLRKNLTPHLALGHGIYDCSLISCGRSFSTYTDMKAHETTHTPFLCPHPGCGLRFSTVAIKNRHAKSHTTNPVVSLPTTSSGNIGAEFKRPRRSNADKEKPSNETSTKKARIARGRMRISTTSSKNQQREDDANTTNLLSRPAAPLSTGSGSHKGSTGSAAKDKRFIWEVDDTDTDSESSSSVSTPKSRQTYRLPSTIFSKSQQDDANTSNLLSRPAAPLSTGSGSHKGSTGTADCDERCPICQRLFKESEPQSVVLRHIDSHIPNRTSYNCYEEDCGASFFIYESHREHHRNLHAIHLCTFQTCDAFFASLEDLDWHLEHFKHYRCRYLPCLSAYSSSKERVRHERHVHGGEQSEEIQMDSYETIINGVCPVAECDKTFDLTSTRTDTLRAHLAQHESESTKWACNGPGHDGVSFTKASDYKTHQLCVHNIHWCPIPGCIHYTMDFMESMAHEAVHKPFVCQVQACSSRFRREHDLNRHQDTYHYEGNIVIAPIPHDTYGDAYWISVTHLAQANSPPQHHVELLLFETGSEVVNGRVMLGHTIAFPIAFLQDPHAITDQQKSDYVRIIANNYVVNSRLGAAKCSDCGVDSSWRSFGLQENTVGNQTALYFKNNSVCTHCQLLRRRLRIDRALRTHFIIDVEANLLETIIDKLDARHKLPAYLEHLKCCRCGDPLNTTNSHYCLGTSVLTPLALGGMCADCNNVDQWMQRRDNTMAQLKTWCTRRKADFDIIDVARSVAYEIFVQGFSSQKILPEQQDAWVELHLELAARSSTPMCFWTKRELSTEPKACPTQKLSFDRLTFVNNKSLSYAHDDQKIVAACSFLNFFFYNRTVEERINMLDQIQDGQDNGAWAFADESYHMVFRFNAEMEMKRPWEPALTNAWNAFSTRALNNGRLNLTKYQWRYIRECARGRSMVTGLPFGPEGSDIDRVFNSDPYSIDNCIIIERGLNFAKGTMREFLTSEDFQKDLRKGQYCISVLRTALSDMEQATRPHRPHYLTEISAMDKDPHRWRVAVPPRLK